MPEQSILPHVFAIGWQKLGRVISVLYGFGLDQQQRSRVHHDDSTTTRKETHVKFERAIEVVSTAIEVVGVLTIVVGALAATAVFGRRVLTGQGLHPAYQGYRRGLGRAILLGLEFLVAGDIIRTVAISPSFQSVAVLAMIVLVRTFLSFSIGVELDGHWPWHGKRDRQTAAVDGR